MINKLFNIITFAPTGDDKVESAMKLPSPWVINGGVTSQLNAGILPYAEFDKLRGSTGLLKTGEIRFYSSNRDTPDHVLKDIGIVDVEPLESGTVLIDGERVTRVISYQLWFADSRRRFQYPRGGRLSHGLINADPEREGQISPRMPNGDLLYECYKASGGLFSVHSPYLNDFPPPANIQWFGAHPANEIKKILDHCDHVFCPQSDGYGKIYLIGEGSPPAIPAGREMPELVIKGLQRAGKTVVITSAPTAVIDRFNGDNAVNDWEYVVQDKAGEWKEMSDADVFGNSGPLVALATKFVNIDPVHQMRVFNQSYCCVRLNTEKFPPHLCPVMRKSLASEPAGNSAGDGYVFRVKSIRVTATIARKGPDGIWRNTAEPVEIAMSWLGDGNILTSTERLLRTRPEGTNDILGDSLPANDLRVEFSVESAKDERKEYFCAGFTQSLTEIEPLTEEAAKAAFAGDGGEDTIIVPMPELRYIRVNGQDNVDLKADLTAKAKARAKSILADSGRPLTTRSAVGFVKAELNGVVAEIRYDQQSCTTTFVLNSWFSPSSALRRDELDRLRSSAFPDQHESHDARQYIGGTGETQPAVPLHTPPAQLLEMARAFDAEEVLVKNMTGEDVDRFDNLSIIIPINQPVDGLAKFQERVSFNGYPPLLPGRFVIAAEPIKKDAIGKAWISGTVPAKVQRVVGGGFFLADICGDQKKLRTSPWGNAQILFWNDSLPDEQWTLIRFPVLPPAGLSDLGRLCYLTNGQGDPGSQSTAANFGYDLHDFPTYADNSEGKARSKFATGIGLNKPRSVGRRTAAPDGSIGLYTPVPSGVVLVAVFGELEGAASCVTA